MSLKNNTSGLNTLKDLINALPEYIDTTGTAVAADIYSGKTATVGGVKLTGTNPYNAANVDPAVADAITALTDKGVDAAGAGLADLAGLIAGIESGGKSYFATYTPSEDIKTAVAIIEHGAGFMPNAYFVFDPSVTTDKYYSTLLFGGVKNPDTGIYTYIHIATATNTDALYARPRIEPEFDNVFVSDSTIGPFTIGIDDSVTRYLRASISYSIILWG